jgi:putative ABC transport system permease protein
MNFAWATACKIAWREARASSFKFGFVVLAVAVGVGSLTGVRGFSRALHHML